MSIDFKRIYDKIYGQMAAMSETVNPKVFYLNKDVKLKNGGRNAVIMTEQDLKNIFVDIQNKTPAALETKIKSDFKPFAKIAKDIAKIEIKSPIYSLSRQFLTTKSGIPYLKGTIDRPEFFPIRFYIYFDGKDLRGYVPTKGNLFNKNTKKPLGYSFLDADTKAYIFSQIQESSDIKLDDIHINEDWCLEDFENRLTIIQNTNNISNINSLNTSLNVVKDIDYYINEINQKLKPLGIWLEETDMVCEDFDQEWIIVTDDEKINSKFEDDSALLFSHENDEYGVSVIQINPHNDGSVLFEDEEESKVLAWIANNLDTIINKIIDYYNTEK